MQSIIFANGNFDEKYINSKPKESFIIAADGGAAACLKLGLHINAAIGDFDSLPANQREYLKKQGAVVIEYPTKKDKTDLELAIIYAISKNPDEIIIYGAMGGRWDMTIANIFLLSLHALKDKKIKIIDQNQELSLLFPNKKRTYCANLGDTLSLIPLSDKVKGVTVSGLEYSLENETLYIGSTRSISNVFIEKQACVSIQSGLLLCVIIRRL